MLLPKGASPKAETARQALLLSVQTLGVNAAAVEEERAAKKAALAENKALLDFVFLGKDEEALGELLREACKEGSLSVVRRALAEGACVDARNPGGWTPLIYAAYAGHLECVKAILETGASIKAKDKHKHTAYDWAMYIRKKTKSYKHGVIEAYLEDYKPALYVKRRS